MNYCNHIITLLLISILTITSQARGYCYLHVGNKTALTTTEYIHTSNNKQEFINSYNAMKLLMEKADLPKGYNRAVGMRAIRNTIGDIVSSAAEAFYNIINNLRNGTYWHAIKKMNAEENWKGSIQVANAKDPNLQREMSTLLYLYDDGTAPLTLMSQEELAFLKIGRLRNANGTLLSQKQKDLMYTYRELNRTRINHKVYQQFNQYFEQQMSDVFGFHAKTQGDYYTSHYENAHRVGKTLGYMIFYGLIVILIYRAYSLAIKKIHKITKVNPPDSTNDKWHVLGYDLAVHILTEIKHFQFLRNKQEKMEMCYLLLIETNNLVLKYFPEHSNSILRQMLKHIIGTENNQNSTYKILEKYQERISIYVSYEETNKVCILRNFLQQIREKAPHTNISNFQFSNEFEEHILSLFLKQSLSDLEQIITRYKDSLNIN